MTSLAKTYGYFFKTYPYRTVLVAFLLVLAGLFEAVGIMAFLPFLQIVFEGGINQKTGAGGFYNILDWVGLTPSFPVIAVFIVGVIVMKAAILFASLRYVSATVARIADDLRRQLMKALLQANWRFFTVHPLGESLNAVVMETFRASTAFVSLTRLMSSSIQFLVYAAAAFFVSRQVFAGGIVIGAILVIALWGLVRVARRAGLEQTELSKDILTNMSDMLQGMKSLRAMALEKKFMDVLGEQSEGLKKSQYDQLVSSQAMRIFHEPLMVATLLLGVYLALTYSDLGASTLALMGVLFIRMLTGMNGVQNEYQRLVTQESALWSLLDSIKDTEDAADNWPGTKAAPKVLQAVDFEKVSFAHGDHVVLSDVNLSFAPNRMSALVGPSGSGKTTALDLLSGFYQPASGRVLINGLPLSDIDLKSWRREIGFVPQEVFLFNDSILENVRVGREEITETEAMEALDAAGARDFIEILPDGLYSSVGESGRKLSGGQRQRIAIARAIVHKPQLLLLDEPTSALDKDIEKTIFTTLKNLSKNMTVICISHNISVIDFADTVYEISNGKIKQKKKAA